MPNKKSIFIHIALLSGIIALFISILLITSCGEGVNVKEANKVLESFNIEWPDNFDGTIKEEVPINVMVNALDQDDNPFNWSGTVTIQTTNSKVIVNPASLDIINGSKNIDLTFSIVNSEENQNTNLKIIYNDVVTELSINIVIEKVFAEYNLTITNDGFGTTEPDGTISVLHGKETQILDTPIEGYIFNQWIKTDGDGIISFGDSYNSNTTVKLVNGDATIKSTHLGPEITIQQNTNNISINDTLDFGRVLIDSSIQKDFTIKNDGYGQLILSGDPKVEINGDDSFTVSNQPDSPILENQSTTFTIQFLPAEINQLSGSVTIQNNDSDEGEFLFNITGEGVKKLLGNDTATGDNFGYSIDASDEYLVIGAPYDNDNGSDSGSAYLFQYIDGEWNQIKKLLPSYGDEDDWFGYSVAINGDFIVIGAPNDEPSGSSSGSIYVFYKNQGGTDNWGQSAKLTPYDGTTGDSFGISVDISGNYIIAGAPYVGTDSGAAYIFYYNGSNWVQQAKLIDSDGSDYDRFGGSVSISGEYAVVGAKFDDVDSYSNSGSACVFWKDQGGTDNWGLQQKIFPSNRQNYDWFGSSVNISGNYFIVGAPGKNNKTGTVYIYTRNETTWLQEQEITADDSEENSEFGRSAKILESEIIIGAYLYNETGIDSGKAYLFIKDDENWIQTNNYIGPDTIGGNYFGYDVGINNNFIFCGTIQDDDNGSSCGSAYIFKK